MDQIINWFMLLIIFVFDPLAIGMVVAANMAFSISKPKNKENYFINRNKELKRRVECSLPEGAEWDKWYSLKDNDHFDPCDVDELKHWQEELEKDEVIEKKVIKEKPKPKKKEYKSPWGNPGGRKMG